jgi:hypothetical protein
LVTLVGAVAHAGSQRIVILEKNGSERARVELDANSRYAFTGLLPGSYVLRIPGTTVEQAIDLSPGQREVLLNLDAAVPDVGLSRSQINGSVRGGSGAVISLVRASDGQEWVTMARSDGSYRFVDLPSGTYSVRVNPEGSRMDGVVLDGANQREINLAVSGWGYTIRQVMGVATPGSVYCSVEGQKKVAVRAHSGDWSSEPVYTGSAPDVGPFACEIGPLEPGHYMLTVDGLLDEAEKRIQLEARVQVDRKRVPLVEFVYTNLAATEPLQKSTIVGRVIGNVKLSGETRIRLTDSQANYQERPLERDGSFAFTGLAAGLYAVEVVDHPEISGQQELVLDGQNQVTVELLAPVVPAQITAERTIARSVITGCAPHTAGQVVRLVDALRNEYSQVVGFDDRFRFEELPAGHYSLTIDSGYSQSDLQVDGQNGLEVEFAELKPAWEAEVARAGSMPGYSVVRVEVEGSRDLPVHIWKEDWEGMMRRTGTKPELGDYALEFSPLGPGHYMVEAEGLGVWTDVDLTGLEVVWINFRRHSAPIAPNVVRPYTAPAPLSLAISQSTAAPYLLLAAPVQKMEDLTALLGYVAKTQPRVGVNLEEALKASQVLIVGDDEQACLRLENVLRGAQIPVEAITQNLAQRLQIHFQTDGKDI